MKNVSIYTLISTPITCALSYPGVMQKLITYNTWKNVAKKEWEACFLEFSVLSRVKSNNCKNSRAMAIESIK